MTRLMNIVETKKILGLSAAEVIRLVQDGRLRAYRYAADGPVNRHEITESTHGLRFKLEDIEELIESSLVK